MLEDIAGAGAELDHKGRVAELQPVGVKPAPAGSQPPTELQTVPDGQQPFMQQIVPI